MEGKTRKTQSSEPRTGWTVRETALTDLREILRSLMSRHARVNVWSDLDLGGQDGATALIMVAVCFGILALAPVVFDLGLVFLGRQRAQSAADAGALAAAQTFVSSAEAGISTNLSAQCGPPSCVTCTLSYESVDQAIQQYENTLLSDGSFVDAATNAAQQYASINGATGSVASYPGVPTTEFQVSATQQAAHLAPFDNNTPVGAAAGASATIVSYGCTGAAAGSPCPPAPKTVPSCDGISTVSPYFLQVQWKVQLVQ